MLLTVRQYRQKISPLWIVSGSSLVWGLEPFGVSTFQGFRVSDWEGSEIQSQTFAFSGMDQSPQPSSSNPERNEVVYAKAGRH